MNYQQMTKIFHNKCYDQTLEKQTTFERKSQIENENGKMFIRWNHLTGMKGSLSKLKRFYSFPVLQFTNRENFARKISRLFHLTDAEIQHKLT